MHALERDCGLCQGGGGGVGECGWAAAQEDTHSTHLSTKRILENSLHLLPLLGPPNKQLTSAQFPSFVVSFLSTWKDHAIPFIYIHLKRITFRLVDSENIIETFYYGEEFKFFSLS